MTFLSAYIRDSQLPERLPLLCSVVCPTRLFLSLCVGVGVDIVDVTDVRVVVDIDDVVIGDAGEASGDDCVAISGEPNTTTRLDCVGVRSDLDNDSAVFGLLLTQMLILGPPCNENTE